MTPNEEALMLANVSDGLQGSELARAVSDVHGSLSDHVKRLVAENEKMRKALERIQEHSCCDGADCAVYKKTNRLHIQAREAVRVALIYLTKDSP